MAKHFLLATFALIFVAHGQHLPGFISIDCGASEDYTDERTGITYTKDANYIDTGVSKTISSEFKTNVLQKQFWNLKSFPEDTKSCYTLVPSHGRNRSYLIRASFMYGNYDSKNQFPEFDLYLGVNKWNTVKLIDAFTTITKEIIHVPQSDNYVHVCMVSIGSGTPFMSVLEMRVLNKGTYVTESGSLELFERLDCGLPPNEMIRYEDDAMDRIWRPFNDERYWDVLNTSLTIDPNTYEPPSVVMSTAITPLNPNSSIEISWSTDGNISADFYIYMHFAEIQELQANQTREFKIFINGDLTNTEGPIVPEYLSAITQYSTKPRTGSNFQVLISKSENSTHPPLLNGFEIYTVKQLLQPQTDQNDVQAIMKIKSMYGLKRNWQGDPCAPNVYMWNGLNCSFNDFDPPRIISLNLSSSKLTGKITPYISDLTLIQILDLSNNSLNGMVPDFLSELPFLRVLNLERNNLAGTLPPGLMEKSKNGSILFRVDENSDLCLTSPCENKMKKKKEEKNNFVTPVLASVGGFLALLLTIVAIVLGLKRRKITTTAVKVNVESNIKMDEELAPKKQHFTYSEILSITNNFERVIGKGGFGTVYYGCFNDREVAAKMLSPSSAQGYKQFHSEAKLLTRVHHRNLTSLIGYCNEDHNMGLIYEYMSNGDLGWHLSDRNADPLSWEERLKIALDAAQGLEYLHNGCKPPIIHRDVKSTNILLNEKLEAKLADFGLSRVFSTEGDETHVSTMVAGTPGYLDPEYYVSSRLTDKSDVFSFGVVMLEMITGRHAIITNNVDKAHVIEWVNSILSKGDIDNIVDPRLLDQDFDKNSVWKAVELAMSCAAGTWTERPTMTQVVIELKQCLVILDMAQSSRSTTQVTQSSEMTQTFSTISGQDSMAR